ncbi:carbamoyltransferase HypF [Desulfatiferula olefinivorans]
MTHFAWKVTITGTVQGVGFRPFVFSTAGEFGITGSVRNTSAGVEILAFGDDDRVARFVRKLKTAPPPLSEIDTFSSVPVQVSTRIPADFSIETSREGAAAEVTVPRDTTFCETCLSELMDKENRRFGHPFINCTQCGPRYSIIKKLPYDRTYTTMDSFGMCEACRREYAEPRSRRFHAQPTCCPDCGPHLSFADHDGTPIATGDPLSAAAQALFQNRIVAIKGVGGFHLACRADDAGVVERLRLRKKRPHKPLALMVKSLEDVRRFACVSGADERLLTSPERPIVLLPKNERWQQYLCPGVTGAISSVGVMLPSSPLHYLMLEKTTGFPLVMTSGNPSGDVLCCDNDEALAKLSGIADFFLLHNRPIQMRIDDSVIRTVDGTPVMVRHARGYVPRALPAPMSLDGLVALGGIQKSSIALGRSNTAYVSQYLGVADNMAVIAHAEAAMAHLTELLGIRPVAVAHDSHPNNLLLHIKRPKGLPLIPVQHHHAHAAACLGENRHTGPAICVVFDGTGWGEDGTLWGGEFLIADLHRFHRAAHLKGMLMPGGDAAVRYPGRMAFSALYRKLGDPAKGLIAWMDDSEKNILAAMLDVHLNCPITTSMGRLFDSAAALLGLCRERTYEGQPAMELEAVADPCEKGVYDYDCDLKSPAILIDGASILIPMGRDIAAGVEPALISARFHNTIAAMTAEIIGRLAERTEIRTAALSGGCFANRLLFRETKKRIGEQGITVLHHHHLPPGDECVSYGQLLIAAETLNASGGPAGGQPFEKVAKRVCGGEDV